MPIQSEQIDTALVDAESLPWHPFLPYADDVFVKLLKVDPVHNEWIALLKAPADAPLPRHQHSDTVMVYTISGAWRYLEHDWVAGPGSFVYETSGKPHTPTGVGEDEVVTLNIVRGDWNVVGMGGLVLAVENWKTMVKRYLDHCLVTGTIPVDVISYAF